MSKNDKSVVCKVCHNGPCKYSNKTKRQDRVKFNTCLVQKEEK